jgi:hypothetical protein
VIAVTLKRARRRRLNQLLVACTTIALAVGLVLVWARVVQTLREPSSAPHYVGQPGALVWDDRVFTSASQLKAYLEAHGLSYSRWAARHPTAFGAPAPITTRHPATKTKKASTHKTSATTTAAKKTASTKRTSTTHTAKPAISKPKPAPTPVSVASPVVIRHRSRPVLATVLTIFLVLGALVLGASAMLPYRIAPVSVQRLYAHPDRRSLALATAAVMLLGFGVSFYLS